MAQQKAKKSDQNVKLAVDNCIFTVRQGKLHILLIQMKEKFAGEWALPGGLIENNETLDQAAKRILKEQTSVANVYLEQLYTFSDIRRDPFGRVVSTAYFSLIPDDSVRLKTTVKYATVRWWEVAKLPRLAYDHEKVADTAKRRLQGKISYSNIAWALLPDKFTLTELQKVYEAILGRSLDKRNFRKKLLNLDLIMATAEQSRNGAHRPARLFQFKDKLPKNVAII